MKAIYRKIGDLLGLSKEAEEIAQKMGIIGAVESMLGSFEQVQHVRDGLIPDKATPIRNDAVEGQLRLKVKRWRG